MLSLSRRRFVAAASALLSSAAWRQSATAEDRPAVYRFAGTRITLPALGAQPAGAKNEDSNADQRLSCMSRILSKSPPYKVRNPRVCYVNWWVDWTGVSSPETDNPNDWQIVGALAEIGESSNAIKFKGHQSVLLTPGECIVSDPFAEVLDSNVKFFIRTVDSVASVDSFRPVVYRALDFGGGEGIIFERHLGADALTLPPGKLGKSRRGGANNHHIGPAAIIGETDRDEVVCLLLTDSITAGVLSVPDANGGTGYLQRGLADSTGGSIAFGHFGMNGTRPSNTSSFEPGKFRRRGELIDKVAMLNNGVLPFNKIISGLGVNDATTDFERWRSSLEDFWKFHSDNYHVPIIQTTLTPKVKRNNPTLNSDTNNQEPTQDADTRLLIGDYIRSVPSPLAGVIDLDASWLNADDPRKWYVPLYNGYLLNGAEEGATEVYVSKGVMAQEAMVIGEGTAAEIVVVKEISGEGPWKLKLNSPLRRQHAQKSRIGITIGGADGTHPASIWRATLSVVGQKSMILE